MLGFLFTNPIGLFMTGMMARDFFPKSPQQGTAPALAPQAARPVFVASPPAMAPRAVVPRAPQRAPLDPNCPLDEAIDPDTERAVLAALHGREMDPKTMLGFAQSIGDAQDRNGYGYYPLAASLLRYEAHVRLREAPPAPAPAPAAPPAPVASSPAPPAPDVVLPAPAGGNTPPAVGALSEAPSPSSGALPKPRRAPKRRATKAPPTKAPKAPERERRAEVVPIKAAQ